MAVIFDGELQDENGNIFRPHSNSKTSVYSSEKTEASTTGDALDELYEKVEDATGIVNLSQEEYDALSYEEKMNGKAYFINTDEEETDDSINIPNATELVAGLMTPEHVQALNEHLEDSDIHVSTEDRAKWSQMETDIAVERARIDVMQSLPEGSTSGDAALEDIKVGYDGTVWDTPGNAVRGQVSQLSDEIENVKDNVLKTIQPSSVIDGYVITNGSIVENTTMDYKAKTYDVSVGQKILLGFSYGWSTLGFACYINDILISKNHILNNGEKNGIVEYIVPSNVNKIIVTENHATERNNFFYGAYLLEDRKLKPVSSTQGFYDNVGAFHTSPNINYSTLVYEVNENTLYNAVCWYGWQAVGISFWNDDAFISSLLTNSSSENIEEMPFLTPSNCNKVCITCDADKEVFAKYGLYEMKKTPYSDKKWCALGDSLTHINTRAYCNYYKYSLNNLGMTYYRNLGVSGSGYAKTYDKFYSRIDGIEEVDFDIMTIFGSGNDLSSGLSLGEYTDENTTTIAGLINKAITSFYEKAPTKKLGLITPTPWEEYCPSNLEGDMEDYADMIIKIAKYRGVPYLDLFHESGIRPWDSNVKSMYYGGDGVHPNHLGHKEFIAPKVSMFIKSLLSEFDFS